tara:strand:+ start:79 stop:348 length:270 start_codon:yes stop_codon:yes gene_type:complete
MIENYYIPSFHSTEEGITFNQDRTNKITFSVGINWSKWYAPTGTELIDIPEQRKSSIISHELPDVIVVIPETPELNVWYFYNDFIVMYT